MPIADRRLSLKTPWLAALLAFLLPGMGHIYQGRFFKGTLYAVCILGTFLMGMCMGEGKVVYFSREPGQSTYGYFSQVMVGLPALPALLQTRRYQGPENVGVSTLASELSAPFRGVMISRTANDRAKRELVSGEITLKPIPGDFGPVVRGEFVGTDAEGNAVTLNLSEPFDLEKPIAAREGRYLEADIVMGEERRFSSVGKLEGEIPRSWINRFEVPLAKEDLEDLNGRLGKYYELALVYTWIAGLLNILAVWDAFEGPAYGYGDDALKASTGTATAEKTVGKGAATVSSSSSPSPPSSTAPVSMGARPSSTGVKTHNSPCLKCSGSGRVEGDECDSCEGHGKVEIPMWVTYDAGEAFMGNKLKCKGCSKSAYELIPKPSSYVKDLVRKGVHACPSCGYTG